MIIKGLRQQSHWSQEQLAVFSGLSLRTIHRIEGGKRLSFESLQGLAAVFGGCGYFGYFLADKTGILFLFCGALLFLGAYMMSVAARTGDEYSVWPWLDSSADDS